MYLVLGFLAYVSVLLGLFAVAHGSAQLTARWLGVAPFRWFDGRIPEAARWRRGTVRAVSSVVPLVVAVALLFVALLSRGEEVATTQIEVTGSVAKAAGLQDGDRILSVDSKPVPTFDAIRAQISQGAGEKRLEIERGQEKLELRVTPIDGRIGVMPMYEQRSTGVAQAFEEALRTPIRMATAYLQVAAGTQRTELAGPVAIVHQVGKERERGSILHLLALYSIAMCPYVAGLHVFDLLTLALFRITHPWSKDSALAAASAGLARIHQALWVSLICGLLSLVLAAIHVTSGDSAPGFLLTVPNASAVLLIAGLVTCRFGRLAGLGAVLVSAFIPCAVLLVAAWALRWVRGELTRRNFEVRWLVAQPIAA